MLNNGPTRSADPLYLDSIRFQAPIFARSLAQLLSSFGGFFAACVMAYASIGFVPWLSPPLSIIAAGFLVRIFIIQHDCGHGSFFESRRANNLVGLMCSLMTLTPYAFWRRQHARHHGSWNNLDRRAASGLDIYSSCMTVDEYRALGRCRRLIVRLIYHPAVANIVLPPLIFMVLYRTPFDADKGWRRERRGVYLTNISLFAVLAALGFAIGYKRVAAVQLPIMVFASIVGVWLFSIQHRFEHSVWNTGTDWDLQEAALRGTSYLHLPRLLQWFTGNIGYHHAHHVNPRIPNYRLEEFHNTSGPLQSATRLDLTSAFRALRYALWDTDLKKLVPFRSAAVP